MKTENAILGVTLAGLVGSALLSLIEVSDEISATSPKRSSQRVKDKTLFNHGRYVTTWYLNEVNEFDENYIKFDGDPYQIYNNSTISKANGKSLEEIMARVGVYNRKNPNLKKETTPTAEGMQG